MNNDKIEDIRESIKKAKRIYNEYKYIRDFWSEKGFIQRYLCDEYGILAGIEGVPDIKEYLE